MTADEVRPATQRDVRDQALLKAESAGLSLTDAEIDEYAAALSGWIVRQGDALEARVAVVDDQVVGMAWMVVFERVPDFDDRRRRTADVQSVFVKPQHRGRGLGRRMVEDLCLAADARGVPRSLVASSAGAITLYERIGFEHSPKLMLRPADRSHA
ncbi:GNAT family N-acetyltransferase [Microbacterium sp. NPDC057650]|uniref:GNAT family N-acetyltransferase n=1 Tax=unclassified Microbacterium TaxID=2609290 RepID=UPI00366DFF89